MARSITPRRRLARAVASMLAALIALPAPAQSLRVDYEVGASYSHSDNINLSESHPDSDAVFAPELRFNATQAGSRVRLQARGALQYLFYRDDTYDDEFAGDFAGTLGWMLVPDRFGLVFEDYLSRQTTNVAGGATPDNQEQVNVFIAGPSFYARFGNTTRGQLDLRYGDTRAEVNDAFDGERYSAALRAFRELNALDWVSFNAEAADVRFDLPTSLDYRRYDAFVGYRREVSQFELEAALGYSRVELKDTSEKASSPLARLRLDWRPSARSTYSAVASYTFGDTATDLAAAGGRTDTPLGESSGTDNVAASPDVFRQRRFELGYRYEGERLDFEIKPYYERLGYVWQLTSDVEARGATAGIGYRIQPLTTLSLSATRQSRELFDGTQDDRDTVLRATLDRDFTRHWRGSLSFQRSERDSDTAGLSYDENLAVLSVSWRR